jgi:hypothetical protein
MREKVWEMRERKREYMNMLPLHIIFIHTKSQYGFHNFISYIGPINLL